MSSAQDSYPEEFFENFNDFLNSEESPDSEIFCEHSFWDFSLNLHEGAFHCDRCNHNWDLDFASEEGDAFLSLWHSANIELSRINERLFLLEKTVSSNLDLRQCDGCGSWFKTSSMVNLGKIYACPRHLGDVVEHISDPEERERAADTALQYASNHNLKIATDLERRTLWERMVCSSKTIAVKVDEYNNKESLDNALTRPLVLDEIVAEALGVHREQSLSAISRIIASKVDTEVPETRLGAVFLLTLLSESLKLKDNYHIESASSLTVENSVPLTDLVRISTAVDLCGQGIPDGAPFDGSLAEEALELVAKRTSAFLLKTLADFKHYRQQ
jgi:hypothetical protein